jgi:hypothetical protein
MGGVLEQPPKGAKEYAVRVEKILALLRKHGVGTDVRDLDG